MKSLALLAVFLALPWLGAVAQQPKKDFSTYGRGHKDPANLKELHAKSWAQHGKRLKAAPDVTALEWDCRTLGIVGPVRDQGQCGKCWDDSECGVLDSAFIMGGWFKNDGKMTVSAQWVIDCNQTGGCDGDDASTVSQIALKTGIPLTQDYGADLVPAGPGQCKTLPPGTKFWKIDAQGYCSQQDGVASTQSIKNAIAKYGPISSAVAAGGFNSYSGGIMQGGANATANDVDHDVSIGGWKTINNVTIWLVKNQWSEDWGEKGWCWIPEGRWQIGYSALWAHTTPFAPIPPTPLPPYKTYEGTMANLKQVGALAGYPTLFAAEIIAHNFADADKTAVMIHDGSGAMVETVQPGVIPPPPGPGPATFTFTFTPAPFSFQTGGFRPTTVTIRPSPQTVTGTITMPTK